jgi:two-component system chemotaxis response regulator CheY
MAKTVLLVDDSTFMRLKMKSLVENLGFQVIGEGANGKEGVDKYKILRPDILLMDITMPEMDGVEALRQIMKCDPKAVVVMVSAMGQERIVMETVLAGAKNFIVKPYEDDKVAAVLKKL